MNKNKWYLLVVFSLTAIVAAGFIKEYKEGLRLSEDAVYYQVTNILNEGEVDAWLNNTDQLDEDPFLDIDYNLLNSVWLEGPHPSGKSLLKVGIFTLCLERTPATERKTGHWDRR